MSGIPGTQVFVSHSSKDSRLVQGLVELIERAAIVPQGILRCTSLPGYDLPLGSRPADALRSDLSTCRLLVGIITKNSLMAPWVLFELGAAWAQGITTILLLSPSVHYSQIGGPFAGDNHAKLDDSRDMLAFLDQLVAKLQLDRRSATTPRLVDEFTRLAKYPGDDPEFEIVRSLSEFLQGDRIPGRDYVLVNSLDLFKDLVRTHGKPPEPYLHALNRLLACKKVLALDDSSGVLVTLNPEKTA